MVTGWLWVDPAVSLLISIVIVWGTWSLLRDSVNLSLDAVPPGIDQEAVGSYLEGIPGVAEVHDLHIWALGTQDSALTAHLVLPDGHRDEHLIERLSREMRERFGIGHATFQTETPEVASSMRPAARPRRVRRRQAPQPPWERACGHPVAGAPVSPMRPWQCRRRLAGPASITAGGSSRFAGGRNLTSDGHKLGSPVAGGPRGEVMKEVPIGKAARASGVKVPTIRYYEQVGLLPEAPRTDSNRRLYGETDIRRLAFIRHARELGFDVAAIRALIDLQDHPARSCAEADAIAAARLEEVEARIAKLNALKGELQRMVDCGRHGQVRHCRVIEILADHDKCLHEVH